MADNQGALPIIAGGKKKKKGVGRTSLAYTFIKGRRQRHIATRARQWSIVKHLNILQKIGGKSVSVRIEMQNGEIMSYSTPGASKVLYDPSRKVIHYTPRQIEALFARKLWWPQFNDTTTTDSDGVVHLKTTDAEKEAFYARLEADRDREAARMLNQRIQVIGHSLVNNLQAASKGTIMSLENSRAALLRAALGPAAPGNLNPYTMMEEEEEEEVNWFNCDEESSSDEEDEGE